MSQLLLFILALIFVAVMISLGLLISLIAKILTWFIDIITSFVALMVFSLLIVSVSIMKFRQTL